MKGGTMSIMKALNKRYPDQYHDATTIKLIMMIPLLLSFHQTFFETNCKQKQIFVYKRRRSKKTIQLIYMILYINFFLLQHAFTEIPDQPKDNPV